jgi:hypothetical protein
MSNAQPKLSRRAQAALELIERHTPANPVKLGALRLWLVSNGLGSPDDRTIKGLVAELRDAGHPVGAGRGAIDDAGHHTEPPGYWYATNKRERRIALAPYWRQIHTSIKRAKAMAAGLEHETSRLTEMEQMGLEFM